MTTTHQTVIGILSPGEMGSALAEVLRDRGFEVITTLTGRSPRSTGYCERSGVAARKCLADVVSQADVIISTVTPEAAVAVASQVRREAARVDASLIYVDANSVSPQTIGRIADQFHDGNIQFVDAAIHGLASRLKTQGTIFASGSAAGVVSELFGTDVRVRILGGEPGNASLMKMALGGMSKGIIGLFLQSSLLAQHVGMADEFCDELGHYYPDVLNFVERSLPTYGQHAARRAAEMRELETALSVAGLSTGMAVELSRLFSALNESDMAAVCGREVQPMTLKQLIEILSQSRLAVTPDRLEAAVV